MSNRIPSGLQIDTIFRGSPYVQESFDLNRMDAFVTSLGVDFIHYKAMPSPIGQNDKGDYRRNDGVDTITSNGMLYTCAGKFTATITDNTHSQKNSDGGILDPAESRLVLPRFYNSGAGQDNGAVMYFMPGDRLYISDPNADVHVANYHKMDYEPNKENVPMFPICKMDLPIVDSQNISYVQGTDYEITAGGNISWLPGGNNPGIDPETGKGRIYSVRYLYRAFWYVTSLIKEIRITNVTNGGVRQPTRAPYFVNIMREYIYHNQNNGGLMNQNKPKVPERADSDPIHSIEPNKFVIPIDMRNLEFPHGDVND
jgi:hypothetical protein